MCVTSWPAWALLLALAGCGSPAPARDTGTQLPPGAVVTLPGWDTGVPALEVPVPDGYTVRTEKGRDFDIHSLKPASAAEALGSIYVGHNPGLLHRQLTVSGALAERGETIGGEAVRVFEFSITGGRIVRETILATVYGKAPPDPRLAELRVHLSVTASTGKEVDTLWNYISKVHVVTPKAP